MKITFIRHGETYGNLEKKYSGITDVKLTKIGLKQSDMVVKKIAKFKYDKIYSSPLRRTKYIAENLNEDICYINELIEFDFGIFEGKTFKDIEKLYPNEWNYWTNNFETYKIPNGESLTEFDNRIHGFLEILLLEEYEELLIITHSGVIRSALIYLLELESKDRWKFQIDNCSIVKLEYKHEYGQLILLENLEE